MFAIGNFDLDLGLLRVFRSIFFPEKNMDRATRKQVFYADRSVYIYHILTHSNTLSRDTSKKYRYLHVPQLFSEKFPNKVIPVSLRFSADVTGKFGKQV